MANKTQRIDERYQIRRGPDGTLLVSLDGVKWLTPAEAGIATEAYADEGDATTLAESKDYTDTKSQEAHEYTDDQIDLAKEELQNYTDDAVYDLGADIEEQLSDKADLINGRVPATQLPAFADTLETFDTEADFPGVGESNVIYVAEDTNRAFRWNGTGYTRIGESLVLGETSSNAYRGDRGAIAYSHTLLTDNPHQVNKTQVGLSNVDNTSDLSKPVSTATQTALNGKANTTHTHVPADITGLQGLLDAKANSSSLAIVATTGDYGDLLNIPAPLDISGKLDKSGGTMSGALSLGSNKITNLASGTDNGDAVNKGQMDAAIAGAGGSSVWGGITGSISNQTDLQTALNGKEGSIAAGATTQYYRGDKSWATLTKGAVDLANVDNTSDANKPISTATQTALNGKADTTHNHAASNITSGVLATARLGSGTANNTKYLAGDSTWKDLPAGGSGDVTGPASATDNAIVRFDGATGKLVQDSSITISDVSMSEVILASPGELRIEGGDGITLYTTDSNGVYLSAPTAGGGITLNSNVTVSSGRLSGRINPRVSSTASASSLTPTIANFDQYVYTALAANLTINAPTGTPVVGNKLMFTIKDNGTSRTLTWDAAFAPVGVTLPTATTAGKWTYVGCIYNASATRWDVIAVTTEA